MKAVLRQLALELGFDACRFTSADPPTGAERLREWLQAGRHGTMTYLERNADKRTDPQKVLPGARTIISLAVSYATGPGATIPAGTVDSPKNPDKETLILRTGVLPDHARTSASTGHGVIARYARAADYHDVLGERLKLLTERIGELGGPEVRSLWYVDTGPLLERELAQRAGIGFIGKHTNLVSRSLGNWFLLAEIITTLPLAPDNAEPNRCGSCTRCLAACPTGAITAPFQLDARRCISYLTIELKGPIPEELRPAIGTRIFGCDDCLAACPWNRFAREGRLMRAHAKRELGQLDLLELLSLDEAQFRARFKGTPLSRAKRRGLLRNVCVALGNLGDPKALPVLRRAAHDPEPLIAEHARWAIDRIGKSRTSCSDSDA